MILLTSTDPSTITSKNQVFTDESFQNLKSIMHSFEFRRQYNPKLLGAIEVKCAQIA